MTFLLLPTKNYSTSSSLPPPIYQIKPENIGFDIRGDVKVFDFGLMKSLDDHLKAKNDAYGYHLTALTGSIPYVRRKTRRWR
jgi:hypothetical protein